MFIIGFNGNRQIFSNTKTEDFLRFLPEQFGCAPEQLEVFFLEPQDQRALRAHRQAGPAYSIDLSEAGKAKLMRRIPAVAEVKDQDGNVVTPGVPEHDEQIGEIVGKAMTRWPYDSDGKFLGIETA